MMVLTLLTKQIDGEFTVYWKTGLRRGGAVDLGAMTNYLSSKNSTLRLYSSPTVSERGDEPKRSWASNPGVKELSKS